MDSQDLIQRIVRSSAPAPERAQLELLVALTTLYRDMGLVPSGTLPALHRACPLASRCWSRCSPSEFPTGVGRIDPASEKGCIVLPWVGPMYRAGGVCVLGMNLRFGGEDWEFAMDHRIARDANGGQESRLRAGKRAHGSYWATGTMRDVAALTRSGRGDSPLEPANRDELGDALLSVARLQAVKCSPVGGRSSPKPEMLSHCPSAFLARELAVLRPGALLAYGRPAEGALRSVGQLSLRPAVDGFRRGTLIHGAEKQEVFLLTHPAHPGWHRAHGALLASLRAERWDRGRA